MQICAVARRTIPARQYRYGRADARCRAPLRQTGKSTASIAMASQAEGSSTTAAARGGGSSTAVGPGQQHCYRAWAVA
eukprot:1910024-Rhodomonas_salina.3